MPRTYRRILGVIDREKESVKYRSVLMYIPKIGISTSTPACALNVLTYYKCTGHANPYRITRGTICQFIKYKDCGQWDATKVQAVRTFRKTPLQQQPSI